MPPQDEQDRFRIGHVAFAETTTMRLDRGVMRHLAGPATGARAVDVHVNHLHADAGMGPYHVHRKAENVYLVVSGIGQVIVDDRRYRVVPGDVVFIAPGVPHAAGSTGQGPVVLLEIYAPAGPDFQIVPEPASYWDADRPDIAELSPGRSADLVSALLGSKAPSHGETAAR